MARVALITGGAQGIGAASAKKLLEQVFGGMLLLDRNAARLEQAAVTLRKLGRVETLAADLRGATPRHRYQPRRCLAEPTAADSALKAWC